MSEVPSGNPFEEKAKTARETLSKVNSEAYRDLYLLSNQVLSKNPYTSEYLNRLVRNEYPKKRDTPFVLRKLLAYYVRSAIHFAAYLTRLVILRIGTLPPSLAAGDEEVILINSFLVRERIGESGAYEDPFFPGLQEALTGLEKRFAYIPVMFSATGRIGLWGGVRDLRRVLLPMITDYQVISLTDLLAILRFILLYPVRVLRCARGLEGGAYSEELLGDELIRTLDQVSFHGYARYLAGKRMAALPFGRIKVISWYENQVIDRNLYRGLREGRARVVIYGAQLFLYASADLNIPADESEESFGLVPDVIVVNGPAFVPPRTRLRYRIGPSLRYRRLFEPERGRAGEEIILVLLPYSTEDARFILEALGKADLRDRRIVVKTHPTNRYVARDHALPANVTFQEGDLYDLFKRTRIAVGAVTGSLLEAASVGIPVVVVVNQDRFQYHILPEEGKGTIWGEAHDPVELVHWIGIFDRALQGDPSAIDATARKYREMYFSRPTPEGLVKAFDLDA